MRFLEGRVEFGELLLGEGGAMAATGGCGGDGGRASVARLPREYGRGASAVLILDLLERTV